MFKLYTQNNTISNYRNNSLTDIHRENDKSITLMGDFKIPFSTTDRSSR